MAVELGVGYISIVPSAKGFQTRLEKLIAGVPAVIDVKADTTKAAAAIQRQLGNVSSTVAVKVSLDTQSVGAVKSAVSKIDVTPDTRGFFDKLKSVFTRQSTTVDVAPNTSNFSSKLRSQVGDQTALGRTIGETAGEGLTSSLTSAAKRAVAAVAAVFAGQQVLNVAKTAFSTAADFEQTEVAFKGLLGNADLAEQKLDELQKFAAATPFNFPQLSDAARKLLAFGFSAEEIIPTMEKLGNAAAALGASDTDINLVVRALGQISTKGRVQLEELNQIAEAFPGANPIPALAASVNKSVPEFTAALSQPGGALAAFGLTGEQAVKVILDGFTEINGASGAMERQSKTLKGALSTLADTLRIVAIQSLKPFLPGIAFFIINDVVPAVEKLGKRVPDVIRAVDRVFIAFTRTVFPILRAFGRELDKLRGPIQIFRETLDKNVDANPGIHNLNDVFAHLADFVVNVTDKIRAFVDFVKTSLPIVVQAFKDGFNGQDITGSTVLQAIAGVGDAVARLIQFLTVDLPNAITAARDTFQVFKDAFNGTDTGQTDDSGFLGFVKKIGEALGHLNDLIKENPDLKDLISNLTLLAGALVAISAVPGGTKVLGGVTKSLAGGLADSLTALIPFLATNPFGQLLLGLGLVGGALVLADDKAGTLGDSVDSVKEAFKKGGFGAAAAEAINQIGDAFGTLWDIVRPKLETFFSKAKEWLKEHIADLFGFEVAAPLAQRLEVPPGAAPISVPPDVNDLRKLEVPPGAVPIQAPPVFDTFGEGFIKKLADLKDRIVSTLNDEWLPAIGIWIRDTFIPFMVGKFADFVVAVGQWIRDNEPAVVAAFTGITTAFLTWVDEDFLPKVEEQGPKMAAELILGLTGAFNKALGDAGIAVLDAIGRLAVFIVTELAARLFLEWPARAVEFVGNLFAELVKQAAEQAPALGGVAGVVLDFIKGLPSQISDAAVGMWDGIYDAFKAAINFIIRAWNSLSFTLPEIDTHIPGIGKVGGFKLEVAPIQELAGGGVFTSKTTGLFSLAETPAARPEIVTPQKLLAQTFRKELATVGAGGGGGVQFGDIVVNGAQASPSSIADAVFAKAGWLHFTGRREL